MRSNCPQPPPPASCRAPTPTNVQIGSVISKKAISQGVPSPLLPKRLVCLLTQYTYLSLPMVFFIMQEKRLVNIFP